MSRFVLLFCRRRLGVVKVRVGGILMPIELVEMAFVLTAVVLVQMAFGAIASGIGGMFADTFTFLLVDMPDFGTDAGGGHLYNTYNHVRMAVAVPLVALVVLAGLARLGRIGFAKHLLPRCIMLVLVLVFFPFLWDVAAAVSETVAAWILNPNFSFDATRPCPEHWSDADVAAAHDASHFVHGENQDDVCWPALKIRYLTAQLTGTMSYRMPDTANPVEFVLQLLAQAATGAFTVGFLGVIKAIISVNLMLLGLAIGIMADLLVGMVISGLPLFLLLCAVPKFDRISVLLLGVLPPLLLLPILMGTIITIGSAVVHSSFADGSAVGMSASWLSSAAVLFLAVLAPVMLIPVLGGVVNNAVVILRNGISTVFVLAGFISKPHRKH